MIEQNNFPFDDTSEGFNWGLLAIVLLIAVGLIVLWFYLENKKHRDSLQITN